MSDKIYLKEITLPIVETGENETYSFVQTDDGLDTPGDAADSKETGDRLNSLRQDYNQLSETKADKNSDNPNMGSGYASQLNSGLRKSDSVPYNFRKVPYDATLEDGSIVGASVAWNQLIADPHTSRSLDRDSSRTYYLSTNNTACIIGHRYFLSVTITEDTTTIGVTFEYGGGTSLNFNGTGRHSAILKQATSVASSVYTGIPTSEASGTKATYTDVLLTDLTQMLGTTIADYVYSLETATAGSGVAWLKEHFPKQFGGAYQAYNAGEIKSISGLAAHKGIGFNQWDEEWEEGGLYIETGLPAPSAERMRSKNFIQVVPNTVYYFEMKFDPVTGNRVNDIVFYDADKNWIGYAGEGVGRPSQSFPFTTPSSCHYIKFHTNPQYGGTYRHDICINISKPTGTPKNGDYVPYESHTYALDSTKTLRGILKLDSNNQLYADGDVYKADGMVTRKYGIVDLGTLDWSYQGSSGHEKLVSSGISSLVKSSTSVAVTSNIVCGVYLATTANDIYTHEKNKIIALNGANIEVYDTAYTDAASFKTAMSGVYLIYELATPATETALPYGNPQVINPDGTESYVYTNGAFELPVGHESEYPVNVSGQLDDILDTPTENGTYTLQATVTDGAVAYEWVSAT